MWASPILHEQLRRSCELLDQTLIMKHFLQDTCTVDAGYKNPSSIYRIICILFHLIFQDIRTFHAGYKNILLENGCHIPYIPYCLE